MCAKTVRCLSLPAILLLLTACDTLTVKEGPAPGVRVRDERAPYATVRMNTVNVLDKSLQDWQVGMPKKGKLAVEATDSRRSETGTLEVWAVLRNRTDYPLQLEGSVQFFDENQAPVEGPTQWHRIYLPPQAVTSYREVSTKVHEPAYYYIEIREGR